MRAPGRTCGQPSSLGIVEPWLALGLAVVELLAGCSPVVVTVLLLGDWLPVEVVLSIELCVPTVEPVVEELDLEAEPPIDERELLVLATLFDGLFIALPAVVSCGRGATALLLAASSRTVPASANRVTELSPAALLLASFSGDEVFDSVTLEVGGAVREAVPEGVMVWFNTSAPPTTIATIVPKAMPK